MNAQVMLWGCGHCSMTFFLSFELFYNGMTELVHSILQLSFLQSYSSLFPPMATSFSRLLVALSLWSLISKKIILLASLHVWWIFRKQKAPICVDGADKDQATQGKRFIYFHPLHSKHFRRFRILRPSQCSSLVKCQVVLEDYVAQILTSVAICDSGHREISFATSFPNNIRKTSWFSCPGNAIIFTTYHSEWVHLPQQ